MCSLRRASRGARRIKSHAPMRSFPTYANGRRASIALFRFSILDSHRRMSRLRAIFLWAVLLAVPFQGYAAASMVFCEPAHPSVAGVAAHAQHAGGHDHAETGKVVSDHDEPDASSVHTCGTCGACHAVGLTSEAPSVAAYPLPQADLAEPLRLSPSFSPLRLDRPPQV